MSILYNTAILFTSLNNSENWTILITLIIKEVFENLYVRLKKKLQEYYYIRKNHRRNNAVLNFLNLLLYNHLILSHEDNIVIEIL